MDHQHDARGVGGSMTVFNAVTELIKKKYYREASECVKMAMEVVGAYYPGEEEEKRFLEEYGFGMLIVSETLYYGNLNLPICDDDDFHYYSFVSSNQFVFDYYSVLHLPPSSTNTQVNDRFYELKNQVIKLMNIGFPGATLADSLLSIAKSNLSDESIRFYFDTKRKVDFVFLDWPPLICSNDNNNEIVPSFKENYLDWKPPVYHVHVIDHMKSVHHHLLVHHDHEKEEEEEEVWVKVEKEMEEEVSVEVEEGEEESESGSSSDEKEEEEESDASFYPKLKILKMVEEEEEEEVVEKEKEKEESEEDDDDDDEDASLSPKLMILKKKVFDEMPQNPHYTPLEKYSGKVREGMILGLEVGFTKLCEEIRDLVDIDSFWDGLDGFNVQLSQFQEMGYNVEKVREKIDILKGIGDSERASRAKVEKTEYEIRDRETVVNVLRSRISDLQARIEESKDMIANSKSKIETLKKDSCDTMAKFTAAAKSNWG